MLFKKKARCNGASEQGESKIEEKGIYVLGSGCAKCNSLEENVKEALDCLNIKEEVKHIRDFTLIAAMGVITTTALVIDNKVVSYGKVLTTDECVQLIKNSRG